MAFADDTHYSENGFTIFFFEGGTIFFRMVPPLNFRSSARDPPPPSTPASPRPRESARERREDICREREGERERGRASEREEERERASEREEETGRERASEREEETGRERASERARRRGREQREREIFFVNFFLLFFLKIFLLFYFRVGFGTGKKRIEKKAACSIPFFLVKKKNRTRAVPSNTVL